MTLLLLFLVQRCAALGLPFRSKAFTRLRRATYFLLRGHCAAGAARTAQLARRAEGRKPGVKKVTKEKATPKRWSPGILPCDCAAGLRGFADSTSVCWQRTGRDPSRPPFGPFLRPAATAYGARLARVLRARATAKAKQSQSPSSACGTFSRRAGEGSANDRTGANANANANTKLHGCGKSLRLGCARCAVTGAPMQWG